MMCSPSCVIATRLVRSLSDTLVHQQSLFLIEVYFVPSSTIPAAPNDHEQRQLVLEITAPLPFESESLVPLNIVTQQTHSYTPTRRCAYPNLSRFSWMQSQLKEIAPSQNLQSLTYEPQERPFPKSSFSLGWASCRTGIGRVIIYRSVRVE